MMAWHDRLLRLSKNASLAQEMRGEAPEQLMHRTRPVCRRCGRKVDRVDSAVTLDRCGGVLMVSFLCHGELCQLPITRECMERGGLAEAWPSHVFDYEAASFGSWDANGAPL